MSPASNALTVYKIETPVSVFPSNKTAGTGMAPLYSGSSEG